MFSPGIEPGAFCVLDRCDNRYTTKTHWHLQIIQPWHAQPGSLLAECARPNITRNPIAVLSRDRLVVRTLRCGRSNPGSNPGHGRRWAFCHFVTTPTFMSRKKVWPRRDSNTQPSDLESDALPLRHGVIIDGKVVSNNLQGQSIVATDVTRCWFKPTSGWHKRRWYSGEHSCLPSSWPGFDSRPTH